jgi:DNA-binding response OmpR family regulator
MGKKVEIMTDHSVDKKTNHILVVDDEPEIRHSLKFILNDCGFKSSTAATGTEALEKIEHEQFDLVITDMRMPGGGGLEVIRELKRKGWEVPVLVVTAYVYKEMAVRALQFGASGYLLKPVDFDELIHRVKELLKD